MELKKKNVYDIPSYEILRTSLHKRELRCEKVKVTSDLFDQDLDN